MKSKTVLLHDYELINLGFCTFQEDLSENTDTLIDIFKPLDGKNIEEIEDATSSVLSNSKLKVRVNITFKYSHTRTHIIQYFLWLVYNVAIILFTVN